MAGDLLIRELLVSQLHAAKQHGLVHREYVANVAMIAALCLEASKGNVGNAMQMLIAASSYLRKVQAEDTNHPSEATLTRDLEDRGP